MEMAKAIPSNSGLSFREKRGVPAIGGNRR
jgi:hypothetical protein